jgi:hypothetical protein
LGGTQGTRSSLTFTPTDDYLIVVPKNQVNYAQLEEASTPSSYILTTTSSATRAAETLTIPAANLPWPEPVVIGEELVTNGTFDTDSDWTLGTGWTISGGVATHSGGVTSGLTQSIGPLAAGKVYKVSFTISGWDGRGIIVPAFSGGGGSDSITVSSNGSYTRYIVTTQTRTTLQVFTAAGWDGSIDNISVKEINPLAVSIAMEGTMTYADEDTATQLYQWYWAEDNDNRLMSYVDTATGGSGQQVFQSKSDGTADFARSSAGYYSPGVNVPFNIASRHGSTFINGAVDGTALTEDTTPVALPDLSTTDLNLGYDFMGTIKTFRVWADDISDVGIEEASS